MTFPSENTDDGGRHCRSFAAQAQALCAAARPPDHLLLGDSTFQRLAQNDKDRRSLGDMLLDSFDAQERAGPASALIISRGAYTSRQFAGVLAVAGRFGWRMKTVTLIINLRSFGPIWMRNPAWSFDDEIQWLDAVANGADPAAPPWPAEEAVGDTAGFLDSPLDVVGAVSPTIGAFQALLADHAESAAPRRLREVFTIYHCFTISPDHPMLTALRRTVALARAVAANVHAYIAPINLEAGMRHVGDHFQRRVAENTARVRQALASHLASDGVHLHDFSTNFPSRCFLRPEQPTEHLNDLGRRMLADFLRREIVTPAVAQTDSLHLTTGSRQ